MAQRRPLCCIINYDTKDGTSWRAAILAYSVKDAVEYLQTSIPQGVARINTTEGGKEIDVIHPAVRKDYLTENVVEEVEVEVEVPVEVEVEVIKEVFIEAEDDGQSKCPWCKKKFKSENTLKTHCLKYHLKDE
jgi:hypothetical protein